MTKIKRTTVPLNKEEVVVITKHGEMVACSLQLKEDLEEEANTEQQEDEE